MTPETYTEFVNSRFKRLGSFAGDMLHACVGMVGEWGEMCQAITRENFLEELGDFDFYLTEAKLLLVEQGVRFDRTISFSMQFDQSMILVRNNSIELLDQAKKGFIYNKAVPPNRYSFGLENLDLRLDHLAQFMGSTREAVRLSNVEKLKLRYPTGYSDQAAQARADKGGQE